MTNTHPIPPEEFSGKNLSDHAMYLEVAQYGVAEWTPERDGKGKPEAVILHFELGKMFDGVTFGVRLKSKSEVNRLIAILQRCRDGVWK